MDGGGGGDDDDDNVCLFEDIIFVNIFVFVFLIFFCFICSCGFNFFNCFFLFCIGVFFLI